MLQQGEPFVTDMAKSHGKMAKELDNKQKEFEATKDKTSKEFWYWLGYFDGQDSITKHSSETSMEKQK